MEVLEYIVLVNYRLYIRYNLSLFLLFHIYHHVRNPINKVLLVSSYYVSEIQIPLSLSLSYSIVSIRVNKFSNYSQRLILNLDVEYKS